MRQIARDGLLTLCFCLIFSSCSSPEQKAQRLFFAGKYEEVIWKYPNLPLAQKARQKVAEALMAEGQYQRVMERFPDLPLAKKAKVCLDLRAAIYGAARVELVETDSSQTELHIYADSFIHPEETKDKFLEFLTTAAARVGQWSLQPSWKIADEIHFHVDLLTYMMTLEQCRQAASLFDQEHSLKATTYVLETARMEAYSTIKLK